MNPRTLNLALGLLLLALPASLTALLLERPPYLQQATYDSIIVRWRTDVESDTRLRYGTDFLVLDGVIEIPGSRTEHEVPLTGLSPDTRYFYDIGSSTEVVAGGDSDHFFHTAPLPGTPKPFRMWVLGDSGKPNADVIRVRDSFLAFSAGVEPEMVLMLGDNAYEDGTDADHTNGLFQVFPTVLRSAHLWPTPGNHEFITNDAATQTGAYFEAFSLPTGGEAGGVPSGTEAYYSFDYGNVHFITLDSTDSGYSSSGAMYQWLEADLMANTREWVIAYWHHPPYSKGSHDSDVDFAMIKMRDTFLPLLEDHGVDLTLTAHSHAYERSMLIDGHYGLSSTFGPTHILDGGDGDPSGTGSYLKQGGGVAHAGAVHTVIGSSSRLSIGMGSFDHPIMVRSIEEFGSVVLDLASNTVHGTFLDDSNQVLDEFELVKGPTCADGADNDGDGLVDLLDPGCADANDLTETDLAFVCDDGIDNDLDGLTDVGADPGCDDRNDGSEQSAALVCDNGLDDDLDGGIDLVDPGCSDALDSSEQNALVECDDGIDNDGDTFIDLADPHCTSASDMNEGTPAVATLSIPIAAIEDDAEERVSSDNSMYLTSTDLELVEDGATTQAVGLRFLGLAIPPDSTVLDASVQFTVDEVGSAPTSLVIAGELHPNPLAFTETAGNLSSRATTTASVTWDPPAWSGVGLAGPSQRTPDLSPVVQEIIDQTGWSEGNAVVLIVTGSGHRTAYARSGTQPGPTLEVTFLPEPGVVPMTGAGLLLLVALARARSNANQKR